MKVTDRSRQRASAANPMPENPSISETETLGSGSVYWMVGLTSHTQLVLAVRVLLPLRRAFTAAAIHQIKDTSTPMRLITHSAADEQKRTLRHSGAKVSLSDPCCATTVPTEPSKRRMALARNPRTGRLIFMRAIQPNVRGER
jgi:hypothetical protein